MNIKLKTKKEIEEQIVLAQNTLQLSSKASVMRLAIALSLNDESDPTGNAEYKSYNNSNQDGLDYNRYTILGDDDFIYKMLCQQHLNCNVKDTYYFPELINAHLERGISLLQGEIKYNKTKEKFMLCYLERYK